MSEQLLKTYCFSESKNKDHRLNVLFIDDDPLNAESLAIAQDEWVVSCLESPQPLFDGKLDLDPFHMIFVDLVFHPAELQENGFYPKSPFLGYKVLNWFKVNAPQKPLVVVSGLLGNPTEDRRFKAAYPNVIFFPKPLDFGDKSIQGILERLGVDPRANA